ncbi:MULTISPECIES: ABC transporter ATP-binding protein [Legionella]|uniref:ABC transporter ATP-binding protein n=1 Tax=Legionella septentrionalis TaxID=2498109 RepID=A0A3S0XSM8_9GAMM|nr:MULTISPECIES: ABC transporter ATP-binding protein [Legionella]MCP0914513.1 ABC transporter ATP-binding protein [Legionella sp. 27cVA30]RUQ85010.1 ABC transporter ATP-binding protein [Legionella septentrionalis]RUR02354.1 ABC transporter ATP-binding protein [Legionella septentrionalis]RUR10298.1 ABC transporter ATP-binding protein [Legionella septentrionalis]RUR17012.1 ABC transporter ATP-binding protein [Legionella septentrionalis]
MVREEIINVANLRKSFNNKVVVDDINLHVKKGEVFGFLGPNGSGKTTTIRMLCGLLTPDSGEGTCLGYDIVKESGKIKEHVGYMTQRFSFYTDLSIEENLNFIANVYLVADRKRRIAEIMEDFGLTTRRKQLAGELSGGWKQRMALAACLLHKPDLLLLDEPTAGIDPIARRDFWDRIHSLSEQGITTLMSTHYMDEAERCTRLAYIANSKLIITGTVDEVIKSTRLRTWELRGDITTKLLQEVKKIQGITQAALFGRQIHVCGFDVKLIEHGLQQLAQTQDISWEEIASTLEDAFISLVHQAQRQN